MSPYDIEELETLILKDIERYLNKLPKKRIYNDVERGKLTAASHCKVFIEKRFSEMKEGDLDE